MLTGVLGFPVAHSRSPAMHGAAFAALGLAWRYLKLPVPPGDLAEVVRALPGSGYRGANVTIPHKEAALALADAPSPAARAIGAANTLTFTREGIEADNTDAPGLLDALESDPRGRRALVLGAGGSGRAVAWALAEAGAEVRIWNRSPDRARALADLLGVAASDRVETKGLDLLVNTTSVGLAGEEEADALAALGLAGQAVPETVVDLVYGAGATPVIAWAERDGAHTVDGLEVLVRQGARSFERWTGRAAPVEVMRRAVRHG